MKDFVDIFREIDAAQNEEQKIRILRDNISPAMIDLIKYTLHENGEFFTTEVPDYTKDPTPDGLAFSNLYAEIKRFYVFRKDYPLSPKRKAELLIQTLESLGTEAPIFEQVIRRNFKSLTLETVNKAFPNLIPQKVTA